MTVFAQIMKDHKPTESTEMAVGSGVSVGMMMPEAGPEELRTMQRFDTVDTVGSEVFYAVDFEPRGIREVERIADKGRETLDREDNSARLEILESE